MLRPRGAKEPGGRAYGGGGGEEESSPQHNTPGSRRDVLGWGEELGKRERWKKGTERKEKRNITNILLPSPHDFIKNWVSSKPGQDLLPQGEKKKKKKDKHLQSIFLAGSRSKSSRYLHKGPAMYENRMTSFPWVMVMRVWCPEAQMRYQGP